MRSCIVVLMVLASSIATAGTVKLSLGQDLWTARTATSAIVRHGQYRADLETKAWTVEVRAWPTSSVFVQSADEQLARLEKADPGLAVLRRERRAKRDWVIVIQRSDGSFHGVVLRPGPRDNAMCTFSVARDWAQPLAACRSLEPAKRARVSVRVPEVEPRIEGA